MLIMVFVLMCVVWAIFSLGMRFRRQGQRRSISDAIQVNTTLSIVFGSLFLFFELLATFVSYANQYDDATELIKFDKMEKIYGEKAEKLTAEFAKYLGEAYPNLEKEVFKAISPNNINIYLVKYPELKSSQTILALTTSINELQSRVYDMQLKRAAIEKDMTYRPINPWLLNFMLPKASEIKLN